MTCARLWRDAASNDPDAPQRRAGARNLQTMAAATVGQNRSRTSCGDRASGASTPTDPATSRSPGSAPRFHARPTPAADGDRTKARGRLSP